jgi:DNA-binding CsgD family transcriptional regulator
MMNKKNQPTIDDVILQIHAAPLEPQGWRAVAQSLLTLCRAESALIIRVGLTPKHAPWLLPLKYDPASLADYSAHWGHRDVWFRGAVASGRVKTGVVSTDDQLLERREFLKSDFYNDFLKHYDIERMMNVCLSGPQPELGFGASALSLYRPVGHEGFTRTEAEMLDVLSPHLAIAARTTWQIESLTMVEPLGRGLLDEVRIPLFGLDATGQLCLVNHAGAALMRAKRWITAQGRTLGASATLLDAQCFKQVLAQLRNGSGASVLLTDGATRQQAVMTTVPIAPASSIQLARTRLAGFVWIIPCNAEAASVKHLGRLYDLTPAEIALLENLVRGLELGDAAEALHISIHTARTQLKAIFRKTGRRTQGQLLALANRMTTIRMSDNIVPA